MAEVGWETWYYSGLFLLSVLLSVCYLGIWQKRFDVHFALIFMLIPIVNLGYLMMNQAANLDVALIATKQTYLGGCFLQLLVMLTIFSLCDIRLKKRLKVCFFILSAAIYLSALTIGRYDLFYSEVSLDLSGKFPRLIREYGVMHTVFTVMVLLYFVAGFGAIGYSFLRKKQVSRKILLLLFLPEVIAFVSFYAGRYLVPEIELIPAAYLLAQLTYLGISRRVSLYDVADTAMDSLIRAGKAGLISFDFGHRYLGSNDTAKALFPDLKEMTVDYTNRTIPSMRERFLPWMEAFDADENQNRHALEQGENIYQVSLSWLYGGKKKKGYQLLIQDDTRDQRYIRLLNNYNEDLQREVEQKTIHLQEMHDNLVLSMATVVESRDNSTGGHIRRTSDGIRMLIDAAKEENAFPLEEQFCRDLIKAAPMHDLGKIAVDDRILRKPGKFTPEEYAEMKKHAAEGARIVHEVLKATDDLSFHLLAENVAHYHHERWDGKGYPEGLKEEEIPLEARIMAVADVYDALVSKRVYKEKFSFEDANRIMLEGMGSQFDPSMKPVYLRARPQLEAYYAGLE